MPTQNIVGVAPKDITIMPALWSAGMSEIEKNLEAIELGFISLLSPERLTTKTITIPRSNVKTYFKRPDLPRCSQLTTAQPHAGERCTEPATWPEDMCAHHFRKFYGHDFKRTEHGYYYIWACRCGLDGGRSTSGWDPIHNKIRNEHVREYCPLKAKPYSMNGAPVSV